MPKQPWHEQILDASLSSRVRGLVLGLALGDAVGSKSGEVPPMGVLEAGAATQLAAWTIEGTLRSLTRYGQLHEHLLDVARYAYQRWGLLRGLEPVNSEEWHPFFWPEDAPEHQGTRGWLVDTPAMRKVRGSSPSTEKALITGRAVTSAGCQALLRVLPVAAMAHVRHSYRERVDPVQARLRAVEWARNLALLTHEDGQRQNASVLACEVLIEALVAQDDLKWAIKRAVSEPDYAVNGPYGDALLEGFNAPGVPQTLERLAVDKTSWSALAGGIYVALSFPGEDTIAEAFKFAGWAQDADAVASVAGAILGARHGYEALPEAWMGRLELGWVMDRLACDLFAEMTERQGGPAWKDEWADFPTLDAWWDIKYPGT